MGYIMVKVAPHLAIVYGERKRNFVGEHLLTRGYFAFTVGRDEEIRKYIHNQEKVIARMMQVRLLK